MTLPQLANEIRDMNLSYLLLAQAMIRSDKTQALPRLGMSQAVAELLAQVAPQQLMRIASRNLMLCAPRFDDELVFGLLTDRHVPSSEVESGAGYLPAGSLDRLDVAGAVRAEALA
jgi:flagellar transcriptional activator FlhD